VSHLANLLRHHHVDGLIQEAEMIRTWPEPTERANAATRCVQQAMYEQAIGQLSADELKRLTDLLACAVEPAPAASTPRTLDPASRLYGALKRLAESPDVNLDEIESETREALSEALAALNELPTRNRASPLA
jgi:hypothetical protein